MYADLSMRADLPKEAIGKNVAAIHCPQGKCMYWPWVGAGTVPAPRARMAANAAARRGGGIAPPCPLPGKACMHACMPKRGGGATALARAAIAAART
jgi:hypothetical protein